MVLLRWVAFGVLVAVCFSTEDAAHKEAMKELTEELEEEHPNETKKEAKHDAKILLEKINLLKHLKEQILIKQYPFLAELIEKNKHEAKTVEDVRTIEGDMDPTEEQVDVLIATYKTQLEGKADKRAIKDFAIFPGNQWGPSIKYCLANLETKTQKNAVQRSVDEYRKKIPCLTWTEVPSCTGVENCMGFKSINDPAPVTSCHGNSPVGRVITGHIVNINNCDNEDVLTSVMIHEMGHSLGFPHTQSRADRDNYVDIQWANIQQKSNTEYFSEYVKEESNVIKDFGVPYDYKSIMHYGPGTFGKYPGDLTKPTMLTKDKSMQNVIGTGKALSDGDVTLLKKAYCETKVTPECRETDKVYKLAETKVEAPWVKSCQVNKWGMTQMIYSGCNANGKNYENGGQWSTNDVNGFVMECVANEGSVSTKTVGCMINKQKYTNGGRWSSGGYTYECQITDKGIKTTVVGCEADGKQISFGGKWIEGTGQTRWIRECRKEADGSFSQAVAGCYLNLDGKTMGGVSAGCAGKVGNFLLKCPKSATGSVGLSAVGYSDAAVQAAAKEPGITSTSCPAPVITK